MKSENQNPETVGGLVRRTAAALGHLAQRRDIGLDGAARGELLRAARVLTIITRRARRRVVGE